MVGFDSAEGLDALPRRIFLEGEQIPLPDPLDGFIRPIGEILPIRDLLACSAALVVAPPWTGKTFVSRQIKHALTLEGRFCERTSFEAADAPGRNERLLPDWWSSWKDGEDQAWWLVDALDEDERREDRRAREVLDLVRSLPPEARSRLHLILFCRLNEIPPWCDGLLVELFGVWSPEHHQGLRRVRLAGADRETARTIVGSERFDRICELIRRNGLQSLAPLPAVLDHLRGKVEEETLTEESLWRGVLMDLLQDRRSEPFLSPLEAERFEVAQRLAAISTFCGEKAFRLDFPGMETLLSSGAPLLGDLRLAAREVLKKTAVFERTGNGFRFAQDHVRQWLAAFALQNMSLSRVRPLLTVESGDLDPRHEGVMSFLTKISRDPEVRDWIIAKHGGLPDPESVPWSLEGAMHALDLLQESARLSPWGLRLWGEERLGSFSVAGMGEEIARRLAGDLLPNEQQFLLDVAFAIEPPEVLPLATRLVQDLTQDQRVRVQAADFMARFGKVEHLETLVQWVRSLAERDLSNDNVLPTLAFAFYEKNLWTFETTAELALSNRGVGADWLQHRLSEDLSRDRARWLIRSHVFPQPGIVAQHLAEKALRTVLEQEAWSEEEIELMVALALRRKEFDEVQPESGGLVRYYLERSPAARRRLFLEGLQQDPRREGSDFHRWAYSLNGEDVRWLLDLVLKQASEWLWETLFHISRRSECPQSARRQAMAALRANRPDLLQRLREEQRQWKRDRRPREQKRRSGPASATNRLEPLVRRVLERPELDLCQRLRSLSRLCFTGPGLRPANLDGRWEDLPGELREGTRTVCREALERCAPTTIPESTSFSSWILLEAACFDRLAQEDEAFILTPDLIRKWLPALLMSWDSSSAYEWTLRKCFEVNRLLSEDLFIETVYRAARVESGSIHIVQQLPWDLWSERLTSKLEEVVRNNEAPTEARVDLLRRIGRIFPGVARAVASEWADGTDRPLRDSGLDILLRFAHEEGWRRLKALVRHEEPAALLRCMPSFQDQFFAPAVDFGSWPANQLVELEELLLRGFPPEDDPDEGASEEGRLLEIDDDLRFLRDKIPSLLYLRNKEGDRAILDKLAYHHPRIRQWLTHAQAQVVAEGTLAELGRERRRPVGLSRKLRLEEMVKALQDARYRLLRTADDLLNVILEEIQQIQVHARQHLSMLYSPQPLKKVEKRKRLHEDALQAYIACRLADRLPYVLGERGLKVEPISIDREPLAARNTRNDLKVQASSISKDHLAVVIEIKWSDNDEVSTSLIQQLGDGYLLQNGLTHGIYLVGWSGEPGPWKGTARGKRPTPRTDPAAWQTALDEQAQLFVQDHPDRPGLRITPVVLDLSW